jgi:cytochrome c oxidase cbb3-type subunit 3
VRQWRPSDHDHTDNPSAGQVQVDPADAGAPAVPGLEDVTIVAWQQNCTQCHGQLGRGDGPRGPMVKATNLSDPAWQSAASDQQIATTIKNGKGAMPAFNLPDGTIANLVKLVRMMNAAKLAALGAHGAASAPPSSSAAPPPKPSASTAPKPAPKSSAPSL